MIVLSSGHWPARPNSQGAGNLTEHETCLHFTGAVAASIPHELCYQLPATSLRQKIDAVKELRFDGERPTLAVEFHTNVGGGTGPEIWISTDTASQLVAERVISAMHRVWGSTRGVWIDGDGARGWLRELSPLMPTLLIELCFRDDPHGEHDLARLADIWSEYARAIAWSLR